MNDDNNTDYLSSINLSEIDIKELQDVAISITENFVILSTCLKDRNADRSNFNENSIKYIKNLKILCTKGSLFQNLIGNTNGLLESINIIMKSDCDKNIKLKSFQLLANLSVQNEGIQIRLWNELKDLISERFKSMDSDYVNISAMIIYNIILNNPEIVDKNDILKESLIHYDYCCKETTSKIPDFLHILLEYFICKYTEIIETFEIMNDDYKKIMLFYIHDHVEDESSPQINNSLLSYIVTEFKKKSECVLKTVTNYVETIDPQLVVILLDIISTATAHEKYLCFLKDDRSLFLNIACLLQSLHKIGKKTENTFTPIQKLDALTPSSNESSDFEKEISYSFKLKLVKSLANLFYRNKRNQDLAREMEIMSCIFECTNADARNPLIKEWSILAIRNMCENNLENQGIIQSLTKVGNAKNPILSEFKLDDGIFRIT